MNEDEERRALHGKAREHLLKCQLSNSENYDRAILTLSTASLGLSVTFIKNMVEIDQAACLWLLETSWVLFGIAIVTTVLSFQLSQRSIDFEFNRLNKYYLEKDDKAFGIPNVNGDRTKQAGYVSGITFVIALFTLMLFICLNILS